MKKRGFVWISAVLYIALGVVAISLVLTAGLPLINKMKDRNTIIQTKELMHVIDNNIQQVRSEGPGSRRYLDTVIIKGGSLIIDDGGNELVWKMDTKAKIMEPGYEEKEGALVTYLEETVIKDEYVAYVKLKYSPGDLILKIDPDSSYNSGDTLIGKYALSIENSGDEIILNVI